MYIILILKTVFSFLLPALIFHLSQISIFVFLALLYLQRPSVIVDHQLSSIKFPYFYCTFMLLATHTFCSLTFFFNSGFSLIFKLFKNCFSSLDSSIARFSHLPRLVEFNKDRYLRPLPLTIGNIWMYFKLTFFPYFYFWMLISPGLDW